SVMLVAAHRALGTTLFWLGVVTTAHPHFTQGIALYDPQQHYASAFLSGEDNGVWCHTYAALALWYLGYPEQGLVRSHEALTLVHQIGHPFSLSFALMFAAMFHQFRCEERVVQERAEAALSVAQEQGFPYCRAFSSILRGWALLAHQGQAMEG